MQIQTALDLIDELMNAAESRHEMAYNASTCTDSSYYEEMVNEHNHKMATYHELRDAVESQRIVY
jgi:hypothetical protein